MTNRQYFYNVLRAAGLTHAATIGFLGNLDCESTGCEPCRMEGDFSSDLKKSREYAAKVDRGEISRNTFALSNGWGAAQWTWYTRKENLFDAAKKAGKSIGDRSVQADFIVWELKNYFPQLLSFLKVTTNIYAATERICKEYEQPAVNNIDARYKRALEIEKEIAKPKAKEKAAEQFWPPRMLDKNMSGPDVFALQGILCARGYYKGSMTGRFDDILENAVKAFQKDHGLKVDGVAGPLTFSKLLEVET